MQEPEPKPPPRHEEAEDGGTRMLEGDTIRGRDGLRPTGKTASGRAEGTKGIVTVDNGRLIKAFMQVYPHQAKGK